MKSLRERLAIAQRILDEVEPGWTIARPQPTDDAFSTLFVFYHPIEYRRGSADIPIQYFDDDDVHTIRQRIKAAIESAAEV
jgi:hypothetical protein